MDWIRGIQSALDYIESHLADELDYAEIARAAACSGVYFQRIFGVLCGIPLGEYIRYRRLTLAGSEPAPSQNSTASPLLRQSATARAFAAFLPFPCRLY